MGFGLGHAVTVEPAAQRFYSSKGSYYWAGG
jgi:hypothetical protein